MPVRSTRAVSPASLSSSFQVNMSPYIEQTLSCNVRKRHLATWFAIWCYVLLTPWAALAQVPAPSIPDNGLTTASPLGVPPHASTQGTNESITLMNGALNVYIPLLSLPQRGGYSLSLGYVSHSNSYSLSQKTTITTSSIYNNGGQHMVINTFEYADSMQPDGSSFQLTMPTLHSSYEYVGDHIYWAAGTITSVTHLACATNFVFTDWQGNKHPFENVTDCSSQYAYQTITLHNLSDSSDGSFYQLDTSNLADIKVLAKDGTVYHFYGYSTWFPDIATGDYSETTNVENYYSKPAGLIVDANNNQMSIRASAGGYTITDTLGRNIVTTGTGLSYTDSDGNAQQITVTSSSSGNHPSYPWSLNCYLWGGGQPAPYVTPTVLVTASPQGSESTVSITFPPSAGGGQKGYTVNFDVLGRITKIQYPTGGYTRYDYNDSVSTHNEVIQQMGNNVQCTNNLQEVIAKHECDSPSGSCSTEQTTTYLGTISSAGSPYNETMTVTNPLGEKEVHKFITTNYVRTNPAESDVLSYDASGALLRTVHMDYPNLAPPGGGQYSFDVTAPSKVTTTLNDISPVLSSYTSYQYAPYTPVPYGTALLIDDPTEIDTSDYTGTIVQKIAQTWEPTSAFTNRILDRLQSRTVTDPILNVSNTTTNGYDTSGNVTSVTVSGTSIGSYTTSYSRNGHGQIQAVTDPKGNTTRIGYADSWSSSAQGCVAANSSAYPTTVTNALGHITTYTYNACTGTIAAVKDPNSVVTSYTYDALNRLLCSIVTDASGAMAGKSCSSYNDGQPTQVTHSISQDATHSITSVALLDGYGRTTQTKMTSDPGGTDFVDTTYDALGRISTVSNPYRSTGEATYGLKSFTYDALGRPRYQYRQDGTSYQEWSYQGNVVNFYDENRNHWRRTSDAMGRLTQVLEPDSGNSPTLETDYKYDAFGNLRRVDQWGGPSGNPGDRIRTFTYDGLSRLLSATNPESGNITYSYLSGTSLCAGDLSLLCSKTDARGVKATYVYEPLNRLVSKSYSNDTSGTPTSCYQYDSPSIANSIGRLSNQWTQSVSAGSCAATPPATGLWTKRSILAYEPVGHLRSEKQCTPSNCTSGTQYAPAYIYDWAGELITSTNGITTTPTVGTLSFTNLYDGAGHLLKVSSNWSDAAHPPTLFVAQPSPLQAVQCPQVTSTAPYAAFGGLTNATFGTGLTLSRTYNVRMQPTCEVDSGGSAPGQ